MVKDSLGFGMGCQNLNSVKYLRGLSSQGELHVVDAAVVHCWVGPGIELRSWRVHSPDIVFESMTGIHDSR